MCSPRIRLPLQIQSILDKALNPPEEYVAAQQARILDAKRSLKRYRAEIRSREEAARTQTIIDRLSAGAAPLDEKTLAAAAAAAARGGPAAVARLLRQQSQPPPHLSPQHPGALGTSSTPRDLTRVPSSGGGNSSRDRKRSDTSSIAGSTSWTGTPGSVATIGQSSTGGGGTGGSIRRLQVITSGEIRVGREPLMKMKIP